MKSFIYVLSAASLFLSACASLPEGNYPRGSMGDAKGRTRLAYRCTSEAADLIRLLPEYRSAGARRRSQMRNSSVPVIDDMQALCWRMAKSTEADAAQLNTACETQLEAIRQRFGDRSLGDVARLVDSCEQLTGRSPDLSARRARWRTLIQIFERIPDASRFPRSGSQEQGIVSQ